MNEIGAALQPWGWALSLALAALVAWVGWSLPRRFATVEALALAVDARREGDAKLTKAIDDVIARVERVEIVVKTLPSFEQIHKLDVSLERMSGRLDSTNTRLDGFGDLLRRTEGQVDRLAEIIADAGRKSA